MDMERNLLSAVLLMIWSAVLLALSSAHFGVKIIAYMALSTLIVFHVSRRRLTYELVVACVAASLLLVLSDPLFLPQTVLLTVGLLVLLALCLFAPLDLVFLVIVFVLGITYTGLFLVMVATRTDPAFTGLVLVALAVLWMAFVRPTAR